MSSSIVEVTCPKCHHVWTVDVEKLKQEQGSIFKSVDVPKVSSFRVQCPFDGTWVVIDVEETDG
jgi:hypothetical protein